MAIIYRRLTECRMIVIFFFIQTKILLTVSKEGIPEVIRGGQLA